METIKPISGLTISYFKPLLLRYARRLIHDATVAEQLVKQVLEDQYEIDGLAPSPRLRQILKTDLLNRCHYWKQAKIFDRPLIKVPLNKSVRTSETNEHKPLPAN